MSALNRDLSKVIVVDWDRNATKLNESNALHLRRWNGDPSDTTLFDLIPFLRSNFYCVLFLIHRIIRLAR